MAYQETTFQFQIPYRAESFPSNLHLRDYMNGGLYDSVDYGWAMSEFTHSTVSTSINGPENLFVRYLTK